MSVFIVFTREETRDASELQKYAEQAPAAAEGRPLTQLAFYGPLEVLEGPVLEGAVILQFPTKDDALEWYRSDKYQAAREHRLKGATYRVFLVEGVDSVSADKP